MPLQLRSRALLVVKLVIVLIISPALAQTCPTSCNCYSYTVDCSGRSLTQVPQQGIPPTTTHLYLRSNNINDISVGNFTGLNALQELDLSDNHVQSLPYGVFDLPNLQTLRLRGNSINSINEGAFTGLNSIKHLVLSGNAIGSVSGSTFRGLGKLENLRLDNNTINTISSSAFTGLNNLRLLDLRDNAIKTQHIGDMRPNIQGVDTLKLSGNDIDGIPRDSFQGLTDLKNLDLSRNKISSVLPGAFHGLPNIQSLDLNQNEIVTVPGMMFAQLPSLRVLQLHSNPWNCDCKLLELVRWMQVTTVDLVKRNETVCAATGPYTGLAFMPLADISQELGTSCPDRTTRPLPPFATTRKTTTKSTSRVPSPTTPVPVMTTGESRNSPPPPPQGLSNTAVIVIAVVVSLAAVTVAACVLGYLLWAKRKRREEFEVRRGADTGHDNTYMGLSALPGSGQAPPVPVRSQFQKYELDKKDLELREEIGRGAFGVVYLATRHKNLNGFPTEETVVVKTVHAYAGAQERATFVQEIETTLDLGKHPNLLGLVGCCTTSHPPYMVTEYMPYGDLKEFLLKCRKADERQKDSTYDLEVLNKYQIARQIANGMIFISQAGYVHGDLAARNVLVGKDLVVKIADFGLATDVYERGYQRQDAEQKIPVRWMAPERLLREGRYTSKSDVWSFGVVVYEIATLGNVPYPGLDRQLMEELRSGYREPRPQDCPQEMYDLMLKCWQWEEDDRPEFQQLYDELDQLMAACSDVSYLEPFGDPAEATAAESPEVSSREDS